MKAIFFGTPPFAEKILEYLFPKISVLAVVTQPERRRDKKSLYVSDLMAHYRAIPLFQPEKASDPVFIQELEKIPADLYIVVAYGQFLKKELLAIPPLGCVNVHASLLPKYRGAAPMQRALMAGEKETGITIMKMVPKMDAGPILSQKSMHIGEDLTFGEMEKELLEITKPLLLETLFSIKTLLPKEQDESLVTFAPKILQTERQLSFNRSAIELHNLIRALSPEPGALCNIVINGEKKILKILRTQVLPGSFQPKKLLSLEKGGIAIGCQEGALQLLELQLEGKKALKADDFFRGVKGSLIFL